MLGLGSQSNRLWSGRVSAFGQVFAPFAQRIEQRSQSQTERRERIFDVWRNSRQDEARNDSVALKLAKLLREYLWRDLGDPPSKFTSAQSPGLKFV